MNGKNLLVLAMTAIAGMTVYGSHLCDGIVEENDMYIPEAQQGMRVVTGISEAVYNQILDQVYEIYAPEFEKRGKSLTINRSWGDGTVNAYAQQILWWSFVTFPGGLPRHTSVTADGFALVACHEIGHHLGGSPNNVFPRMAVEGQSDYYANTKCLRQLFTPESNRQYFASNEVDEFAMAQCQKMFRDENDWMTCARGAMAGMSVARLFQSLRKQTVVPDFETPDTSVVGSTNYAHPGTQCRLDTYFNGSLCTQDKNIDFRLYDEERGACTTAQGYSMGTRPLCWYKPSN